MDAPDVRLIKTRAYKLYTSRQTSIDTVGEATHFHILRFINTVKVMCDKLGAIEMGGPTHGVIECELRQQRRVSAQGGPECHVYGGPGGTIPLYGGQGGPECPVYGGQVDAYPVYGGPGGTIPLYGGQGGCRQQQRPLSAECVYGGQGGPVYGPEGRGTILEAYGTSTLYGHQQNTDIVMEQGLAHEMDLYRQLTKLNSKHGFINVESLYRTCTPLTAESAYQAMMDSIQPNVINPLKRPRKPRKPETKQRKRKCKTCTNTE